mgnify:CR=1 FL=1
MKKKMITQHGVTMPELLVAVMIFMVAIVGILYSYLKCMELQDLGRNVSLANQAVRNKMEAIKNTSFSNIYTTYNNTNFTFSGINGRGVVYVNNSNAHLLQIKVVFCWKQPNGRIMGEDRNLNGALNLGEDANGNGQIDSYVQITTNIYG